MTTFYYSARASDGEKRSGKIEAENRAQAAAKLERMQLVPISISEDKPKPPPAPIAPKKDNKKLLLAGACALVVLIVIVLIAGAVHRSTDDYKISQAQSLLKKWEYQACLDYLAENALGNDQDEAVQELQFACWMGLAQDLYNRKKYQECRDYILARPEAFYSYKPAGTLFLTARAGQAVEALEARRYQLCLDILDEVEGEAATMPQELLIVRQRARDAQIIPEFEKAREFFDQKRYQECIAQLDSLPEEFSRQNEVSGLRNRAQLFLRVASRPSSRPSASRPTPSPATSAPQPSAEESARQRARMEHERRVLAENRGVWLDIKHTITKKQPDEALFSDGQPIYRYWFDVHNKSDGFARLQGLLEIELVNGEGEVIEAGNVQLDVNPRQHTQFHIDIKTAPDSSKGARHFIYYFSIDGVSFRSEKGYFSRVYEDLTK